MRRKIFTVLITLNIIILAVAQRYDFFYVILPVGLFLLLIAIFDASQSKRTILKNFPLIGHFRYLLEEIRPEIQQYFIEAETDGRPVPRVYRSLIYQRSKSEMETIPFGTQLDVYAPYYSWVRHSMYPAVVDHANLRVLIGGPQCKKPYSASLLNISAMSYGSLSKTAIEALNKGAKLGNFYHNTGEGGISPYHLSPGGDLVWQIGTGYFGCRDSEGNFNPDLFQKNAQIEQVKMIEIKISQGAKPGHGGILPGVKVDKEIANIRNVPVGKTVYSPPGHSEFKNAEELINFVERLRDLSGGKPVGIKICFGRDRDFYEICDEMLKRNSFVDFITVDGGEGGTGAAPLELSNHVGFPLEDAIVAVDRTLKQKGIRDKIKVIASGKVFTSFHIFQKLALGADLTNSARGMMLALGCIQALRCNTNQCPTGVATTLPRYYKGVDVRDKSVRVLNYHDKTIRSFKELLEVTGFSKPSEITKESINIRMENQKVLTLEEMYS